MARLLSSGWELGNVTTTSSDGGVWQPGTGTVTIIAGAARSGSFGMSPAAGPSYAQVNFDDEIISYHYFVRFYLRINVAVSAQSMIIRNDTAGSLSLWSIRLNTDLTLELWNEDTVTPVQMGSDSAALALDTWYRIEVDISASSPAVLAYVATGDGPSTMFASGTPSNIGETASILLLGNLSNTTGTLHFDDVAINNNVGTEQNVLCGPGHIIAAMPNADGDNAMGTRGGTDSGSDWGQIDERTPNDITDYYILDVDNDIIDVNMESVSAMIPKNSAVKLVQVGVRHRASAAFSTTHQARIKSQSGGTVLLGTAKTHDDTTWKTNGDVLPRKYGLTSYTDPQGGGRWTVPLLDSAQIGVIATAATLADFWLTTLWAMIEYMPTAVKDPIRSGGMVVPFAR